MVAEPVERAEQGEPDGAELPAGPQWYEKDAAVILVVRRRVTYQGAAYVLSRWLSSNILAYRCSHLPLCCPSGCCRAPGLPGRLPVWLLTDRSRKALCLNRKFHCLRLPSHARMATRVRCMTAFDATSAIVTTFLVV